MGSQTLTYRGVDINDPANKDVLDELSKDSLFIDLGFLLPYQRLQRYQFE